MTLLEATKELQTIHDRIKATYPGADAYLITPHGGKVRAPRFAWEVRISSGLKSLDRAIIALKSAVIEADPARLEDVE